VAKKLGLEAPQARKKQRSRRRKAAEAEHRACRLHAESFKTRTVSKRCSQVLETVFTACRRVLKKKSWDRILTAFGESAPAEDFPSFLTDPSGSMALPAYIADLARLEWLVHRAKETAANPPSTVERLTVNPSLALHAFSWKNLAAILEPDDSNAVPPPEPEATHILIWRCPVGGKLRVSEAAPEDLLALKLAVEQVDVREAAAQGGVPAVAVQSAIDRAVSQGILLTPPSAVRRRFAALFEADEADASFLAADTFTLQWHITQACDLHCRHCYDRSDRSPLPLEAALRTLAELDRFCRRMHVNGQVSFTGGNPLLYPHFNEVYREASRSGFTLGILGNPSPPARIHELLQIQKPAFYQISLEGLEAHNDYMRGKGHFRRSLQFLDELRSLGIYSMVMLTLTRENMDQVLPLADILEGRADHFSFNRLSAVGEGATLALPSREDFKAFLEAYEAEARHRPFLGLKDNLFNIVRGENGGERLGGCTGYGCGAAFNFMALLADGEVHACRKFPSLIGNLNTDTLSDIYTSGLARRYREGPEACRGCRLLTVCRGCLAVAYSAGLDVFRDKDPYCFAKVLG
jgi:selenobiotic family peptide radical SAM maturase